MRFYLNTGRLAYRVSISAAIKDGFSTLGADAIMQKSMSNRLTSVFPAEGNLDLV